MTAVFWVKLVARNEPESRVRFKMDWRSGVVPTIVAESTW